MDDSDYCWHSMGGICGAPAEHEFSVFWGGEMKSIPVCGEHFKTYDNHPKFSLVDSFKPRAWGTINKKVPVGGWKKKLRVKRPGGAANTPPGGTT